MQVPSPATEATAVVAAPATPAAAPAKPVAAPAPSKPVAKPVAKAVKKAPVKAAAKAAGLAYAAIPVTHAGFAEWQVTAMSDAIENADGKILAYCRSGTRSTLLWALARAASISASLSRPVVHVSAGCSITYRSPW